VSLLVLLSLAERPIVRQRGTWAQSTPTGAPALLQIILDS